MQIPEPRAEHRWLQRLVGTWSVDVQMDLGPDTPPMTSTGRETVRSFGELWTIGEGVNESPLGASESIMTLGYDPERGRFVGTFIGSTMTHLWPYDGALDPSGKVLTLDSVGPSFASDGTMAKYQDIIEFLDEDHRTLSARVQGPDGSWTPFMKAQYRRIG